MKKDNILIYVIFGIVGLFLLFNLGLIPKLPSFSTVNYDSQCYLSSCASGYSQVRTYCDDSKNKCYKVCEKDLGGAGCGSYGASYVVEQKQVDWFGNIHHGDSFSTSSYYVRDNYCYKFYSKSEFTLLKRGTASSYKLYSSNAWRSSSQCKDAHYDGSITTAVTTLGRGSNGNSYSAAGKIYQYGRDDCTKGEPTFQLQGRLNVKLYMSRASWNEGGVDTETLSCSYDCDSDSECGTSGYVGSNYCSGGNVVKDYKTYDCSNYDCYSSTSKKLQDDCGTAGCSGGVCNTVIVTCASGADSNGDRVVSISELWVYANGWIDDTTTRTELGEAIMDWAQGCGEW